MMPYQWTPGPWFVGPDLEIRCKGGAKITHPLTLTSMDGRTDEDRANAYLISASTDMHDALSMVADLDEGARIHGDTLKMTDHERAKVDAALAKARGEGYE